MSLKKNVLAVFLISVLAVLFLAKSQAQELLQTGIKSQPVELNVSEIYIPCEDPNSPLCVPYPADIPEHPDLVNKNHEFGLIAENLPANTDVIIAGCINTDSGARCTTGDPSLDNYLNSFAGGDQMNPDPSHQFKALQNPVKTDAGGYLETIVRSFTAQATSHFFNGYYITQETDDSQGLTPTPIVTIGGVKQGTIDFETNTPVPTQRQVPRPAARMREIHNDPKGRFFDSQSLEPIPEGEVTLLDNLKKIFVTRSLVNPQKVKSNGEFNFWVPNGLYYLDITQKPTNHSWPISIDRVHPNYTKAYYCDAEVKNQINQTVPLYVEQYSIIEYNKLVHCDVPLDPGINSPYRSDVKTVDFSISRTANQSTRFSGHVTHPLTTITLKGEVTGKIAAVKTSDKLGFWSIILSSKDHPLTTEGLPDRLTAFYTKTDLTAVEQNINAVAGTIFEPLLTYVEGYAYDENGRIIPRAMVGYRQQGMEKIVYVTEADDRGYFKISTRYLPSFGYDLIFSGSTSSKPIVYSTSRFVTQNADYLKKNNINLLTKTGQELLVSKISPSGRSALEPDLSRRQSSADTEVNKQGKSRLLFLGIIALVIIIIAIIVIAIILLKRYKTERF